MVSNPHGSHAGSGDTVVGSIDSDGRSDEYVIADISEDGAWLSMQAEEALTLSAMR